MFDSKNADCPFWRAPCKQHGCRLYIHVQGTNPNTGQPMDEWDCSLKFLPFMMIEVAQQARQAGASTDKVANEVRSLKATVTQSQMPPLNNKRLG